jgi:hypothetical protein
MPAMPDDPIALAKINITNRREPDAPEMMILSDGASEAILYLSPLGEMNMLLEGIGTLVQLIVYGGEHIYLWEGEQTYYHWRFDLDGETLHIRIYVWGKLVFSTTCSLWQFSGKLRLCASRLAVAEDARHVHGGDWVRRDTGYQQLSALLDERKSKRWSPKT